MEENPTRVCELIVGLGDVEVLGVEDAPGGPLAVHICTRRRPVCGGCGGAVWSKGSAAVWLVDLAAFGRPARLVWRKWRWRCPAGDCAVGSFTEVDERIAPARAALTARAGRWATMAVGRDGRSVSRVVVTAQVNDAVIVVGPSGLDADCGGWVSVGVGARAVRRSGRWRTRPPRWTWPRPVARGPGDAAARRLAEPRGMARRHHLGRLGPLGAAARHSAARRAGRRSVPRDPTRQRRRRRDPPQGPERHARPPRPQTRPPLPRAAAAVGRS